MLVEIKRSRSTRAELINTDSIIRIEHCPGGGVGSESTHAAVTLSCGDKVYLDEHEWRTLQRHIEFKGQP